MTPYPLNFGISPNPYPLFPNLYSLLLIHITQDQIIR